MATVHLSEERSERRAGEVRGQGVHLGEGRDATLAVPSGLSRDGHGSGYRRRTGRSQQDSGVLVRGSRSWRLVLVVQMVQVRGVGSDGPGPAVWF